MASQELRALVEAKRANPYRPELSVADLRRQSEEAGQANPVPTGTTCRPVDAGGVAAEWIETEPAQASRTFLFIHGGGYYRGSVAATRATAARISRSTRARVLSIDYRLSPENPFPAAIDDTVAAYRWLLDDGAAPARTVVGGISAGGGLTLALLLAIRDANQPLPAAAVPMSAWTDLAQTGDTFETKADVDPVISKPYLDRWAASYLGDADPRAPLASPLYGDLHGLPPLLMQVGASEVMLADSTEFARLAKAAGNDVTLEVWDEMIHGWQGAAHVLPEARQAIERIGTFFDQHVS